MIHPFIFFTVTSTGICFPFLLNTGLKKQRCFCYCRVGLTQSQGLFFWYCHSIGSIGEETKGCLGCWEETQSGQDPN